MKIMKSILFYYGVEEFYFKDSNKVEVIIAKRNKKLNIKEWINMINAVKFF